MAISINWSTKVINIPQADLTLVSGTVYEYDVNAFRLELKDVEDGEGMPFLDTHRHNTEIVISGVTYARTLEIINGYTVTFEDGQYSVNLFGANNNVLDVLNRNQVSVSVQNSAGLVGGANEIAAAVWRRLVTDDTESNSMKDILEKINRRTKHLYTGV